MNNLTNQGSVAPTRKQSFNLLGSQIVTVGLVFFAIFAPEAYARIPEGYEASFGAALAGIFGFFLGWLVRERQ
jgi:hypothetical protein